MYGEEILSQVDILESIERDERAMERIASALERWVTLQEQRFAKEFPEPRVKRDAELIRADERSDQYSDKPSPEWLEETRQAAGASRFAIRAGEGVTRPSPAPRRRIVEVPEGDGNKPKPS